MSGYSHWDLRFSKNSPEIESIVNHATVLVGSYLIVLGARDAGERIFVYNYISNLWWTFPCVIPETPKLMAYLLNDGICVLSNVFDNQMLILDLVLCETEMQPIAWCPNPEDMIYVEARKKLIALHTTDGFAERFNQVYEMNVDASHWKLTKSKGEAPRNTIDIAVCAVEDRVYVWTGCLTRFLDRLYNELYVLSSKNIWSVPMLPGAAVHGAKLAYCNGRIFVYGGKAFSEEMSWTWSTFVVTCDVQTKKFSAATIPLNGYKTINHTVTYVGSLGMVIIGGERRRSKEIAILSPSASSRSLLS